MKALTLPLALLAIVAVTPAQSLRSQIIKQNKVLDVAMKKKDFAYFTTAMKQGSTADFKYTEAGKSLSFDQMLQTMKMGLGMMSKLTAVDSKLLTLKQSGNSASGTTYRTMACQMIGPDKKMHSISFSGTTADTYRKEGGKWKMARA